MLLSIYPIERVGFISMKWPFIVLRMKNTYCTEEKAFSFSPLFQNISEKSLWLEFGKIHSLGISSIQSSVCSHVPVGVQCVECVYEKEFYLWNKMLSDLYRIRQREECQPKAIIMLMKPIAGEKFLANATHEEKCQQKTLMSPYKRSI